MQPRKHEDAKKKHGFNHEVFFVLSCLHGQTRAEPSGRRDYFRIGAPINKRFFGVISAGMDCVQTR